tara:strand:- start:18391 stop:18714 length:324 start_codon:yes stop_codon:yes gene_type:complete
MALIQVIDNKANTTANAFETLFTAGNKGVIIDSFTAANNSKVNASYEAVIDTGTNETPQIPFKIVVWGEIDLGIGLVNQLIPAGAKLKIKSSAINSIFFTITGREVE